MVKKNKNKKKSPSRIKYEQNHPVISYRDSKELHDRLEAVKKAEGKSTTAILKEAVGLLEVRVRTEKEIKNEANAKGFEQGYHEAETEYKVMFLCSVCKKPIGVTSPEAKAAARKYMSEHGWGHADCLNKKRN